MKKQKFQRSDIPYADRLLMQRHKNIRDHRDEAARTAMQIACVALNDTEGLGCKRLGRFAHRLMELIKEYYADPEVGEVHLKTRLEQLGFLVKDGHMYAMEDQNGNAVNASRCFPGNVANQEDGENGGEYDRI